MAGVPLTVWAWISMISFAIGAYFVHTGLHRSDFLPAISICQFYLAPWFNWDHSHVLSLLRLPGKSCLVILNTTNYQLWFLRHHGPAWIIQTGCEDGEADEPLSRLLLFMYICTTAPMYQRCVGRHFSDFRITNGKATSFSSSMST